MAAADRNAIHLLHTTQFAAQSFTIIAVNPMHTAIHTLLKIVASMLVVNT